MSLPKIVSKCSEFGKLCRINRMGPVFETQKVDTEQLLQNSGKGLFLKAICKRVDERGSATERKPGSDRPKTARTEEDVRYLKLLISRKIEH